MEGTTQAEVGFDATIPSGFHSMEMTTKDNVQYKMHIAIGGTCGVSGHSLGAVVEVLPDTGSADLWVSGANCSNCHAETAKYHVEGSCTANQIGFRVSFGYRDGTFVTGGTFLDNVHIGDLQVSNMTVILVDTMGHEDTSLQADGILGLAPLSSTSESFVSVLFKLYPSLPKQFSFHLSRYLDKPSHLLLGEADMASYSKEKSFQYSSNWHARRSLTWLASVGSIGWSGTDVFVSHALGSTSGSAGFAALVDSGTSLIVLAADIYDQLLPELTWHLGACEHDEDDDILECQCPPLNDLSKMPWFTINIIDGVQGQFSLSMSPDEYMLETVDPQHPGQRLCIPSFTRGEQSLLHPIILGMTFMRSFYTVFDVENMRIGFARSVESPLPAGIELQLQLQLKRLIWMGAFLVTILSVTLTCYVIFDPDPKGTMSCEPGAARDIAIA